MSRKLILSALFLLFTNFTYAEEQQANFLVIEGNNRVSSEEIAEYSGFQVGKIYNNDEISNVIKNLFSTNLFTDIRVNLDQNTLYISVVETPIISRINIDGNKLVESEQITSSLDSVGISQSKPYSRNLVDKVQQELTRLYYDNGRYSSSIDIVEKKA
jgi:outer membrane protein insertion porin family